MSYGNREFIGLRPRHRALVTDVVKKARDQKGTQTATGKDGSEAYAFVDGEDLKWCLTEPPRHLVIARGIWPKPKEGE